MANERSSAAPAVCARLRVATVLTTILILFALAGTCSADSHDSKQQASPRVGLLGIPLSFEQNLGQASPSVQFLSRGSGYSLFLTEGEIVMNLDRQSSVSTSSAPDNKPTAAQIHSMHMKLIGASASASAAGLDQQPGVVNYLIGNDPIKWRTGIPTYGKVRYSQLYPGVDLVFYGNQRRLEYDFVLAPGANPEQIVMEFSGATPSIGSNGDLQLMLDDAPVTLLKPVVYQGSGAQKQSVDGSYLLTGNRVHFQLGTYDHSRALVIDPQIVYLTYLGGSTLDSVGCNTAVINGCVNSGFPNQSLAVDSSGDVYVTGFTESTDFPIQNAFQPAPKRLDRYYNAYVTKLNASGSALVYSTYLGGSVFDMGYSIAVDSNGSAYVAGWTLSPDFPTTAGAYMPVCPFYTYYNGYPLSSPASYCQYYGSTMGFLTKLSPDGQSLAYSTYLGTGAGNSNIVSVAVDTKGQAYVAGNTNAHCDSQYEPIPWDEAPCFPETANALQPMNMWDRTITPGAVNQGSGFVSVFDAAGANLLYSTLYGDSNGPTDYNVGADFAINATGVAVDAGGNFYLTGYTRNASIPTTAGAFQPTLQVPTSVNQPRGFVAKFSPVSSTGGPALLYGTYFGGTSTTNQGGEQIIGMVADASGSAYLAGLTQSPDFPVTARANNQGPCNTNTGLSCSNTAFLTKLKPDGSGLAWSTFVGYPYQGGTSGGVLLITPPRLDSKGNVYVEGMSSAGYPQVNGLQANPGGNPQVFVTKYDPTGSTVFFSSFVGDGGASGYTNSPAAMDVDSQGNIYIGGNAYQPDLPTTAGAFQTTAPNVSGMGFLAKVYPFVTNSTVLVITPLSGTVNAGDTVTFTATVNTGNQGTAVGTVNFLNGTTLLGAGTLDASGVATFSTSTLAAGTYSITAAYPGNDMFAPSTSAAQSLNVVGNPPSISPNPAAFGNQTVNTSAQIPVTVTNMGANPMTITLVAPASLFDFTQTNNCVTTLAANASCVVTITFNPTSAATESAAFTLTDNDGTQIIQATGTGVSAVASQTITFNPLPNVTYGVAPITLTATASSGLPVSYAVTGPAKVSGTTLTITGAGTVNVTASQVGNANFAAAKPVMQGFTVNSAVLTVTANNASRPYNSSNPALTYTITGFVNGNASSVVSGTATETTTATTTSAAGTYPITFATENLAAANYGFTYINGTLTVTGGVAQTITFNPLPNVTYGVAPITLTATASSGLSVSYAVTGPATVSGSTLTIIGTGLVTVTASQAGNANYAAATPVSQSFTVLPATTTANFTITPVPPPIIYRGELGLFMLQLKSVNGFNGNVTLSCSGGPTGSKCVDFPQTVRLNGAAYAVSGILFPKNVAPGTYTITITGTSGSLTNTATEKFTVK